MQDIIDIETRDEIDAIPPIQHDVFTQIIWPYRDIKQVIKEAKEVIMRERNNQDNTQIGNRMTTYTEEGREYIKDKKNLQHAITKNLSDHDLHNYLDWHRENNIPVHNARLLSSYGSMSEGWCYVSQKQVKYHHTRSLSHMLSSDGFAWCSLFSCTYHRKLLTRELLRKLES